MKVHYKEAYDDELYKKSLLESLKNMGRVGTAEHIIYIIKNIITLDGFLIKNPEKIKRLFFYYFVKNKGVSFTNEYMFSMKNDVLDSKRSLLFSVTPCNSQPLHTYFNL